MARAVRALSLDMDVQIRVHELWTALSGRTAPQALLTKLGITTALQLDRQGLYPAEDYPVLYDILRIPVHERSLEESRFNVLIRRPVPKKQMVEDFQVERKRRIAMRALHNKSTAEELSFSRIFELLVLKGLDALEQKNGDQARVYDGNGRKNQDKQPVRKARKAIAA